MHIWQTHCDFSSENVGWYLEIEILCFPEAGIQMSKSDHILKARSFDFTFFVSSSLGQKMNLSVVSVNHCSLNCLLWSP